MILQIFYGWKEFFQIHIVVKTGKKERKQNSVIETLSLYSSVYFLN